MKTDLEIAQDQLELALKEIKSIKDRNVELLHDYIFESHRLVKNCSMPAVVGRSEQLVSFLRQYQKSCEIMHVNKIDAKNFVEQYKTN